jgi:hypothetical protein
MSVVFLGGTCTSSWRDRLIPLLDPKITYFNPIVDDWTEEAQRIEEKEKEDSEFNLYVITPKMKGVFSVCEATDDSNKMPDKTLFVALKEDEGDTFDVGQWKSLQAVIKVLSSNGAFVFDTLEQVSDFLNDY